MKNERYRLKKWYPGISDTWSVGTVVYKNPNTPGNYWPEENGVQQRGVPYDYVEKSPEYWEKIPQRSWDIEAHSGIDKSFGMGNDRVWMKVDYDDVNHPEVDAAAKYIKVLVENGWNEDDFKKFYRDELQTQWENEKDLQEEHPNLNDFLDFITR